MVNPDRTQVHFCTCGHRAFMFGFTRSVDPALGWILATERKNAKDLLMY